MSVANLIEVRGAVRLLRVGAEPPSCRCRCWGCSSGGAAGVSARKREKSERAGVKKIRAVAGGQARPRECRWAKWTVLSVRVIQVQVRPKKKRKQPKKRKAPC